MVKLYKIVNSTINTFILELFKYIKEYNLFFNIIIKNIDNN